MTVLEQKVRSMTERMTKKEALAHWRGLPKSARLKPRAISNRHKGSTYGYDGVRIEGSREFIDAILGRLSDLIECENGRTRINLNYTAVTPRPGKDHNGGEFVCYIKIHERGDEAKAVNAFMCAVTGREFIA
jgi:hypothetical protein